MDAFILTSRSTLKFTRCTSKCIAWVMRIMNICWMSVTSDHTEPAILHPPRTNTQMVSTHRRCLPSVLPCACTQGPEKISSWVHGSATSHDPWRGRWRRPFRFSPFDGVWTHCSVWPIYPNLKQERSFCHASVLVLPGDFPWTISSKLSLSLPDNGFTCGHWASRAQGSRALIILPSVHPSPRPAFSWGPTCLSCW